MEGTAMLRRLLFVVALTGSAFAQLKEYKPSRWNLFSTDQDVQMGKEAAEEVRKTMPIVNNKDLTDYVNRIGARLAKSKRAGGFPYTFEVLNDPSINAFALPGGPMFVHTGLIAAVDNESQLAGVLAHEMSHVALRHGSTNVSKANIIQLPAMLGANVLGAKGGIWGTLGQLGIGLGAQSVLLKYSRDAEKEADLNGAQIMNDAGYDPTQMAIFFDKLQADGERDNSKLANFMSDHPTPGRRVDYVNAQNKLLPKVKYSELEPGTLPKMKQVVASIPPPPKPAAQTANAVNGQGSSQPTGGTPAADPRPSGKFKTHQGTDFQLSYPDNWEVFGDTKAASVTIAPRAGMVQNRQGQADVGYGFLTSFYFPTDKKPNLQRDTAALLKSIVGGNPGMQQTGNAKNVKVGGMSGMLTPLASPSTLQDGQKEIDMLLTVMRPEAIFYIMFVAPDSEWKSAQPAFDQAVNSLRFTK
ncbi:MAG: M48 family metallopeptidase [Acidobacteriota bacterium]